MSEELDNQESIGYIDGDSTSSVSIEENSNIEDASAEDSNLSDALAELDNLEIPTEKEEEPVQQEAVAEEEETPQEDPYADDPYRTLAEQYGWNPEKGDKSPKEFMTYPFERKISKQSQELNALRQDIKKLTDLYVNKNVKEVDTRVQQLESFINETQDADDLRLAYKELNELKQQKTELPQQPTNQNNGVARETMAFLTKHQDWFPQLSNPNARPNATQLEIQQYADQREKQLTAAGMSLDDTYATIEVEVQRNIINKTPATKTINRPKAEKVGSGTVSKDPYDLKTLSTYDREMYEDIVIKNKLVSKKDFFESVSKRG